MTFSRPVLGRSISYLSHSVEGNSGSQIGANGSSISTVGIREGRVEGEEEGTADEKEEDTSLLFIPETGVPDSSEDTMSSEFLIGLLLKVLLISHMAHLLLTEYSSVPESLMKEQWLHVQYRSSSSPFIVKTAGAAEDEEDEVKEEEEEEEEEGRDGAKSEEENDTNLRQRSQDFASQSSAGQLE